MATKTLPKQNNNGYVTATYFSLFLGMLGVDRFYMGYIGLGIVKLLTFGGLGIWWLIDVIWIALGNATTKNGTRLTRRDADMQLVYVALGIFLLLQVVGGVICTITYVATLNSIDNNVSQVLETLEGAVVEASGSGTSESGEGTVTITFPEKQ